MKFLIIFHAYLMNVDTGSERFRNSFVECIECKPEDIDEIIGSVRLNELSKIDKATQSIGKIRKAMSAKWDIIMKVHNIIPLP